MYLRYSYTLFVLSLALLFTQQSSFADNSDVVKLKHAGSFYWSGAGSLGRAVNFAVRVKNIGYHKNVSIVYNNGGSGWNNLPLTFYSHHGNYDTFTYNNSFSPFTGNIEFAIKYEVNGNTYWNNNDGNNFLLPARDHTLIEGNVTLNEALVSGYHCANWMGCTHATNFKGEIYVSNYTYHKNVGIAYSIDGGEWKSLNASYSRPISSGNLEIWGFDTWIYTSGDKFPQIRFAVYFQPDWDNNFGQDYFIQLEGIDKLW